jgi:ATP-dependent DNA ligase
MDKVITCISNVFEAISNNTIKGNFTEDKMTYAFPIISTVDRKGNTSTWQIAVRVKNTETDNYIKYTKKMLTMGMDGVTPTQIGVVGVTNITHTGKIRKVNDTLIRDGKNIGKKNETNPITQAILYAHSKYKEKFKKTSTNLPENIILPMLLKDIKDVCIHDEEYQNGVIVERKIDGIRALSYLNNDNKIVIYSRTGMKYDDFNEIEEELQMLIDNNKRLYIDGELYRHGNKLQDISGAVRGVGRLDRKQIKLIIFDCFYTNDDGEIIALGAYDRKLILDKLFAHGQFKFIEKISWMIVNSREEVNALLTTYLDEEYEGLILRRQHLPYEQSKNNYHSSNVLKVKPYPTAEFDIVGYGEGKHGKDVGALIISCTADGTMFNAVPKGLSYIERSHIFKRFGENHATLHNIVSNNNDGVTIFERYVNGKPATIQYSILSKTNTPQQPKFINIRDDEIDVISILLNEL